MRPPQEDLAYEDEESEEEQPLPFAIRGNDDHQEVERGRRLENRMIIHNRALGDINTIAEGSQGVANPIPLEEAMLEASLQERYSRQQG